MRTFRIAVGHDHGVKPGNIVGAIANEANIESKFIGRIDIYDDYTVLDLPDNLPAEMMDHLKSVRVAGQALNISGMSQDSSASFTAPAKKSSFKSESTAGRSASHDAVGTSSKLSKVVDRAARFGNEFSSEDVAAPAKASKSKAKSTTPMQSYRIEVGREHEVTPSNIVGAIANEAGLEAKHIGKIDIFDSYTTLDLPLGMPDDVLRHLRSVWVAGKQLNISEIAPGTIITDKPAKFSTKPAAERKAGGDRRVLEKPLHMPVSRHVHLVEMPNQ